MKQIILSLFTLLLSQSIFAHEGHGEAPGMLKAIHGGTILGGKEINLEYLTSGPELKIFPEAHEGDILNIADIKISATTALPKKKAENLKLQLKEGAYVGTVDLKKSHRAEVIITTEIHGKKDHFKFQVER
ncbi:MAG: hypothetical protein ACXVCY_16735 [Pseudobdellovibrionaceae bacterium]